MTEFEYMEECLGECLFEEADLFCEDWERMEILREPTLAEVVADLEGRTSYKFSLMGTNAFIAVDGAARQRVCEPASSKPRVLSVHEPV